MPTDPSAAVEISAFRWVPPFAAGLVRDLRIRWALEEIGRDYRVRLLDGMNPRPDAYFAEQPFGQVPIYRDKGVELFESGAILIHLGLNDERLLPADESGRMRGIAWLIAALNSVEPMIFELVNIDIFNAGQDWTKERRPQVVEKIRTRLKLLGDQFGVAQIAQDADHHQVADGEAAFEPVLVTKRVGQQRQSCSNFLDDLRPAFFRPALASVENVYVD